ncbi:MAG TPA: protein kinase [Terriglobales bacterium]|nr:protein kinase [Terriglobales bacterium]
MALAPGTKIGPYEIQAALGAGGMGEVYRARDTRLERMVAIKILASHLSPDSQAKQRFEREARVISSLNHPNICHLYDIGNQDGVDFLVMEFLEGETLGDRLRKGPLPSEQMLKYALEICEGLEKAHKSGVVHRDLKPANIMLTKAGAKLMDFGLAKAVDQANPPSSALTATIATVNGSQPLTAQGMVVGTFQYISPEQLEGKEADERSDIFALGAVLYEMATGKRAFEGKTTASVIAAVLERDPAPISAVQPASPSVLDRVVKTCIAKDPDERFQTMHDLKLQLKWIAEGGSQAAAGPGTSPSPKRNIRERVLAATALLLATTSALLGVAYFRRPAGVPPVVRSSIQPPPDASFSNGVSNAGYALSPDGTRLVFSAQTLEGQTGLWIRPLNSLAAQKLAGTDGGGLPFWSPDGQWIGFFADGKMKKVSASGGYGQVICDAPLGRGATWNRQGVIVFAPNISGPLYRVSENGGVPAAVTQLEASTGETTHRWPSFLPDGMHFLYVARQVSDVRPAALYVGSLSSLSRKKVFEGTSEAQYSSGWLVFARNTTLVAQKFDLSNLQLVGEAVPVADDVRIETNILRTTFTISQAGQLVYSGFGISPDIELIVIDRLGKQLSTLETAGNWINLRLSPDGTKLAVAVNDSAAGGTTIWINDLRTSVRTRFTFGPGFNANPTWSPDGSQLAFTSSRSGIFSLYVKPATGTAEEKLVRESPDDERPQSWSADGRYLVIDRRTASRQNIPQVAVLSLTGDRKTVPYVNAPYLNFSGQISPDGRWLAYVSNEFGRPEVFVSSFPEAKGKWQVSSGGGHTPRWRRDERELFFCGTDGVLMGAEVTAGKDSFALGAIKPLLDRRVFQNVFSASYDVFPDGQRFILASVKAGALHSPLTLVENWPSELKK